ncbi:hypothetical protein DSO57_1006425 [Entomophthora muscae]|uniref:Uncharacterized protein n=1 Tax=Entomophthora muscae TaxID=34485 RepID=A0ACC2UHA4_9FUNG|nr:hypothetical protein DSO57_1006425 [Entomophthora muscae]
MPISIHSYNSKQSDTPQNLNLTSVDSGTTDLLDKRMESWRTLTKSLSVYFTEVMASEEKIHKTIRKAAESLSLITEPKESIKQFGLPEENGVNMIISTLLKDDQKRALSHADVGTYISSTVLAELKKLKSEVKSVQKEMLSDHSSLNMRFAKARENSKNCYKKLSTTVSETVEVELLEADDPWIIHQRFLRHLQVDIQEDNMYQTKVRASVNKMITFETSIVRRIKSTVQGYIEWRTRKLDHGKEELGIAMSAIEKVKDDQEWLGFIGRQDNPMLVASASNESITETSLDSIEYPLKGHPYLTSHREGRVSRKTGIRPFKSWKEAHMVVTATGYLYLFPDENLLAHSAPDFSLHLTHCHVSTCKDDREFRISGKKMDSMFSSEKDHLFKAATSDECNKWIEVIQTWVSSKSPAKSTSTIATEPEEDDIPAKASADNKGDGPPSET